MKQHTKLYLLTALLSFGITAVHAQRIASAKVPDAVRSAFSRQYPGITVSRWEKEKEQYEASFRQNGQSCSALFTAQGSLTESEVSIPVSTLPPAVTAWLKTNRRGLPVHEAAKITKAGGAIEYEAEVSGKDILFDANGNYLRTVQD